MPITIHNRLNPLQRVAIVAGLIIAAALAFGSVTAYGSTHLVLDTFTGRGNTDIQDHSPEIAPAGAGPAGAGWFVADGAWVVRGGMALDTTKVKEPFAGDRRAVISTGSPDMFISATIKRGGGNQMQGLVGRYLGPADWTMAFYDGVGDVVLGVKRTGEDFRGNPVEDPASIHSGGFQELGRVAVTLINGEKYVLGLSLDGDEIAVFLDGVQILPASPGVIIDGDLTDVETAGIFLRGNGPSRFDDFAVTLP